MKFITILLLVLCCSKLTASTCFFNPKDVDQWSLAAQQQVQIKTDHKGNEIMVSLDLPLTVEGQKFSSLSVYKKNKNNSDADFLFQLDTHNDGKSIKASYMIHVSLFENNHLIASYGSACNEGREITYPITLK